MFFLTTVSDVAKSVDDIMNNGYKNSDMFDGVKQGVATLGSSAFHFLTTLAIFVFAIALAVAGTKLASRDSRKRQEAKSHIGMIMLGCAGVFGIVAIIVFIEGVSLKLKGF